ncbi:MAG TPA: putative maltokinase, partial [Usitatibacter sp.]|nr:putative maltokinase [Usitatibacter sp.]
FRTMRFWLDMGVDGFRLDAIPYLVEREGTSNENNPETHAVVKKIRAALDAEYKGKLLLAEANMWPEDVRSYFGDGDECHMAYHFPMMPRLYMSIAMEDRHPLVEILGQTPPIPPNCQWAIFLRNHDELTLEMVTDRERDYMYRIFATESRMRVNVGIRRRLAPLMENSRAKIELITFLLMTMPGAPILYYGDEIGMGDNIFLGDRNGVRTPMQWSPDRNAGFSRADPQRLYLPPIMDAMYGFEAVNVEAQARTPSSLLNWTRRLIATRRAHMAFGRGTISFLEPGNRKVIAFLRETGDEAILCVANLSRVPQAVELDVSRYAGRVPVELFGGESFPPVGKLPYLVTLAGHGYMAFRLATDAKPPGWHEERLATRRLPVLVLAPGWEAFVAQPQLDPDMQRLFQHVTRERLREQVFLPYLRSRRWFAAREAPVASLHSRLVAPWEGTSGRWHLVFLEVELASGETQRYFLPLGLDWETRNHDPMEKFEAVTITKLRHKDRVGIAYAAFADPRFNRDLARAMAADAVVALGPGELRFSSNALFHELAGAIDDEVRTPAFEQSNTAVFFGNRLFLKAYRRLRDGVNPELEMGRFLTEKSPFPNIAPIVGAIEYVPDRHPGEGRNPGEPVTLAIMQRFVENQGDLWTVTLEHLGRLLTGPQEGPQATAENAAAGFHLGRMALLGRRIAELHRALARQTGDPLFDPEPATDEDVAQWRRDAIAELDAALAELPAGSVHRAALERAMPALRERIASLLAAEGPIALAKSRYHGDPHLGQVIVAQDDFVIVDFEGEPARSLERRRQKSCVLRDVAGMLRSFGYAAHAALGRRTAGGPGLETAVLALGDWERDAARHFVEGYAKAGAGVPTIPTGERAFNELLELFLIEKAAYELRYEIAHRPDWVEIPLRGLTQMVKP